MDYNISIDGFDLTFYPGGDYDSGYTRSVGVSRDGKGVGLFSVPMTENADRTWSLPADWTNARYYNVKGKRDEIVIHHPKTLLEAVRLSVENYQK